MIVCEISGGPWDGKVFVLPDTLPPPNFLFPAGEMTAPVKIGDGPTMDVTGMKYAVCVYVGVGADTGRAVYRWPDKRGRGAD